jgi:DNA-directed RNA polymerase subunit RPC12/RpoP
MAEVRDFFRHCPACGRRFHIKLVDERLVDEKEENFTVKEPVPLVNPGPGGFWRSGGVGYMPLIVEEDRTKTVDVRDFQYSYKCKHCGHVWTEMHEEQTNV